MRIAAQNVIVILNILDMFWWILVYDFYEIEVNGANHFPLVLI